MDGAPPERGWQFPSFDVSADGARVAGIFEPANGKPETELRVVLNLAGKLQRKLSR
jgi:hypothetical protein